MKNTQHLIAAILIMVVTTMIIGILMVFIPPTKQGFAILSIVGTVGLFIAVNQLEKYFV
jgi:hypothetical protein